MPGSRQSMRSMVHLFIVLLFGSLFVLCFVSCDLHKEILPEIEHQMVTLKVDNVEDIPKLVADK